MQDVMQNASDIMSVVGRTEQWIDSHRKETEHGLVWALADEAPTKFFHSLYAGSAGIALFYLELYQATGEGRYLENARNAGRGYCQLNCPSAIISK
jgi:hypothetical protein